MPTAYAVQLVDDEITLHRPCFGADDPLVLYALRSNHENRRSAPRPPELADALLDLGVSMFSARETVTRMARRRPDRVGTHVLTLILLPGFGIATAATGAPGHHSVWGGAHDLLQCVVDVQPI